MSMSSSTLLLVVGSLSLAVGCGDEDMSKAKPRPAKKTVKPSSTAADVAPQDWAKQVVDCWTAFDARDATKYGACYGDASVHTMVDFVPPASSTGGKDIVAAVAPFWAAFPDIKHDLQLVLISGNNAVVVALSKGTNTGEIMGMPPTGNKLGMLVAQAVTHRGGVVTADDHWVDQGTMMGQLGLAPAKHPAAIESLAAQATVAIASGTEVEKANLAAIRAQGEAFDRRDVATIMQRYADDAVFSWVPSPDVHTGKAAIERAMTDWFGMSSDVKGTTAWMWAAGDYVVMRATSTGTHDGDMGPMKRTGKTFSTEELHVLELRAGKIAKHQIFANSMKFAAQLGMLDPAK